MKIRVKKAVEAPNNVKEVVQRISSTPLQDIAPVLRGFKWTFDKGDINHWVPVLDHFDSFLEEYACSRADLQLRSGEEGAVEESAFPADSVLAVLNTTCCILENCSNKGAYNSTEHLSNLLAAPAMEVTAAALQVFQVLMRKTHHTAVRLAVSTGLTQRLLSLCKGWGGKEEGLELAVCASTDGTAVQKVLHKATTLRFEFTPEKPSGDPAAEGTEPDVQPVTLHVPGVDRFTEPEHVILAELVRRYKVPPAARFDLLCRIRIARNFGSLTGRRQLVHQRLLAFNVLLQCSPSAEEYNSLYLAEPEIVSELVGLVQAEEAVEEEDLRTLALKALAAQLQDRSRSSSVITAVTSGGQSGLLAMLLHKSVASILQQANVPLAPSGSGVLPSHVVAAVQTGAASSSSSAASPVEAAAAAAPAQGSVQYSASFVDALLTLVAGLVTSSSGCQALNDAGVISALLPLLRDHHPDHLNLVCTSLKILEMYMDLSQTASTTFRDLGGLTAVIKRLAYEVGAVMGATAESTAATPTAGDGDVVMASAEQQAGLASPAAADQQAAGSLAPKQLPHNRKSLLKILLRIITISSYQPTGNLSATRPVDDDAQLLYASLKAIYRRAEEFGGTLFSHAVQVMTDLIHHEPQSFRQLQEAGLPDAFLTAVKAGVFPGGECVCAFPGALVALCLNSAGLKQVRETAALNVLGDIFTAKKAMRVLTGDTPSVLGSGLEELMRFVPSLRSDGVNVVLGVFKALCILGGDEEEAAEAMKPLPPEPPAATVAQATAAHLTAGAAGSPSTPALQPMDTDAAASSAVAATDQAAGQSDAGPAARAAAPQQGTGAEAAAEGMDVDVQPETAADAATGQQPGAEAGVAPPAAAAGPAAAAAANAQQEREVERERQQAEDDWLAAIAKRVLAQSLQKVAAKKDQETDVEAFLPLALTAASRMLEPLLANAETSRLFVERGGADLLLKLYKLPRLTTVFNFSSASHSLLSVFRALSGAHGTAIAAKSKEAVAQQVAVLLPMAEQVGPVCVPTLPADVRDKYSKQVLVVQGLVALTSAVARNVSAMLPQVSMGDPPLLASMGKLERIVLAQAAASDPWKQARDAAKKAAAAAEASAAAPGGGNTAAEAAQDGGAGGGEAADAADHDGAGDEDMEGPAAEQPADRSASEAAPSAAAAAAGSNNGKQKRTPEDTAYDALSYLLTSMRTFYMGTAKAIHTPVRRREDTLTTPTAPMKAAALSLALLLVGNLQLRPWQQQQQQSGQGPAGGPEAESSEAEAVKSSSVNQQLGCAVAAVRCRSGHFLRVVEEVNQVLFDSRRHYCHLLVLNYFSALGGMQVYAATFKEAADLLWNLLDLQGAAQASQRAAIVSSGDQPMTDEQIGSNTRPSDGTAAAAIAGPGTAGTKDPKQIMEAVLVKMLAIYEQLANATVLLSAPQATQMLLAALPNYAGQPLVAPAKDALHFVLQLHSRILAAVLPLWSHPRVACAPPGVLTAIIRVLQTCSQGPGPASMILRYSQRPAAARSPPQPDAAMVQQIIEMGFSQARAEEALRRVGANSVELAMEWLITHSEEPAAAAGAQAGGAAATGAAAADAAATEDEELTRALLASLSVVGMSPDAVAQRNQQQQPQQQQSETEAAASAGPAEGSTATASDQEAVTPQRTPRPVVQPGAPVLGAAAAAAAVVGSALQSSGADAAGIPAPTQLIDGAIRLIATSPATAFSIADLVFTIVQREDGKDREAILERLMNDCLPPAADTASSSAAAGAVPADADVLTPARLLLLLLHKDTASRQLAAHKGLVARCLQVLEGWQAQYSAGVQYFERLTSQQQQTASETKKLEIPVWVEAVLMLLEIMTTTQVKSSAAAASRTALEAARATATAAALQATGPAAGGAAASAAAAAAGEDTPEAAPARPAADQAADGDVQMAEQPEAAAAPAAASAAPAPPAAQEGTAHPPELQLAGMTEALANWKPCGLLDEQQQQRATSVAVTLLQQLHSHADQWDQPDTSMYEADGSVPNPGSVTTVVLQLLNHLTKRYSNAQQVLAGSVHQLLLSLPAACLAPSISRQEGLIGGILRHMLEDPVTLESWMESEIKNSMSVKARDPYYSARPYYNRRNPMSRYTTAASFLTMMSSLVGRDPAVFLQAAARTCALETSGGETMVRLRTVREQQQQQSAVPSTAASRDASAAGAPPASAAAPVGAVAPGPPVTPPAGSRSAAAIESTPAAVPAQDHMVAGASERTVFKSSSRSSRKLVPASFVEVVDALLDVVLSYQGFISLAELAQQQQQGRLSDTAAMDVDAAATMADQQAPAAPATASEAPAKPAAAVSLDVTPLPTDLLLRQLNPVAREAGIQSMVLRLLADYCLLYNNTVGLLLKRDTDSSASDVRASLQHHHHQATPGMQQAAGQEGSKSAAKSKKHSSAGGGYSGSGRSSMPGLSSAGAAGHDPPKAGVVLKHIMHVQLVDPIPDGTQSSASVASNASALLQAVCIRSGEGRKRLMSEVVSTLTAGADMITNDGGSKAAAGKAHHKLPYRYQQGGPEPAKVSAYVNLMGSLVQSGSSPGMSRSDPRQSSGTSMSLELLRAMREAGAVKALAQVLKLVNTDHVKAKDAINAVLKPLEVLTRPLPKQVQPAEQQELRTAQTQAAGQRRRDTALAAAQTQAPASATATTTAAVLQAPTGARQPAIAVGPPAAAAAAGHAAPVAGGAAGRSSESVGSAGRAAMDEDQRPHAGEEAAGPDALAAAGRFVAGGAGQARTGGRLAGGLIDQLMEQLVDIEVELEAGAVHDDDGDVDSSASGGSADDGDVSDEGSDDSDEDMAEEAQQAQAELEGPGAMVGSEEGGVGDAASLTDEEDDSDGEGPHAELVLGDAGAAFINPDDEAAANGALGHDMADMDSSGEPESDEDQHHHHAFDDELLPEDDMHLLPPQLDAGHHAQQDGVGDPLDDEEEEEEADEYLDDEEEHSDDDDDDARYDIDAAAEEFLNGGGRFSFDVPMPGELDDMPAALMMPGGFGRAAARRMAYRPGAAAATAGVWDDSEPGDATHDPLSGAVTVQMMLNQLGINAGSGGSVAMIGPNGRQYRMAVLAPEGPGATAGGRAGSEAMAGAMNSALYSLSTQLMPQQHRLLALPPRVPVSDSTALLESAGASVSAAASAGDAGVAGAASGLRSQASSVQALTRLLARAPEGPANPGYMRDGVRARMTAQRAGNNLFSVHLNPAALPTTLGTATNFLQSLELLQPGGLLGGPPGAGALADLDNTVWDDAVNQLLEALAPQGVGRARASAGPVAPGAARAGGAVEEAGLDPRSLESQMLALLRAHGPPQQPQQQQQPDQRLQDAQGPATAAGQPQPAQGGAAASTEAGAAAVTDASGAGQPSGRRTLTEEVVAAAFRAAMHEDQPVAAEAAPAPEQPQQQQQIQAAAEITSHPVEVPPSAPESDTEGDAGGSTQGDQLAPMDTEDAPQQPAAASTGGQPAADAGENGAEAAQGVDAAAMDVEGGGEVLHEALRQAAEAAAVDLAFLEALPEELRVEVLSARGVELRLPPPAQQTPPQQPAIDAAQAPPGTDPPPSAETAAVDASAPAPDASAAAATPGTEEAEAVPAATAAAAAQAAPAEDEEPSIDPEFLAALPVDIRQEVLAQQAADRRARATQRAAQQRQQEMGLADLLAAMDDDARADALGQLNDSDLAQLPPAMRTQAQALRERVARQQQVLQQQQAAVAAQRQQQHDFMLRHVQLGTGGLGGLVPGSNRLLIPLGADGLPLGGRNRLGPLTAALGGRGPRGAAGRAELLDAADQAADEPEGPPLLGEAELAVLIHLLRASLPISKVHLQKLLLNLVGHSTTREQLLKMLLGVLRSLPGASSDSTAAADADAEHSSSQPGASMDMSDDGSGQPSQQGLSAALDMLGSAVFSPVSRSSSVALADSSAVASSASGKPAVVSRRVVDMLAYLSRHSQQVSVQMLKLQVPGPDQTGNGKGKLPAAAGNSSSAPRALEVLLAMLSTPLCQRSISLLEQVALLLEVVLSGVQRYEADRAALAAMKEARRQQQEEESNKKKQEQQQPGGDASNVAQAAQPQQQQQQPTDRLIDQAAGSTPFQPGGQQPQPSDEQPQRQQPPLSELTQTLVSLQPDLLQQLPSLLALETLSESAYMSIAKVIKLIVESALVHLPLMLSVLVDGVAGVANALLLLLDTATDKGIDADAQLAPAIGTKSGVVLRMLYALQGFQAEVSERLKLQEQQQQQDKAVEAAASRSDHHPTVAAGESSQSAAVTSSSAAGSSAAAVSRSSLDPVSESAEVDKAVASVASRTAPLWKSLSSCILRVEDNLRAVLPQHSHAAGESAGHAAARLLPPGAQQVLPLVEAFFVLCALQGAIPAAPGPAKDLLTAPSADQLGPTSTAAAAGGSSIGRAATPLPSASGGQLKRGASVALDATDSALPFLRFAERHRRLLNAYIRRNTSLLESSLAPLLRVPRLIDFDNKRGYFKSKIRAQDDRTYAGGLRLAVKRSTVFEDSFNKLRSRTPAEMRGKLSVSFIGEEGIDAGGVSREWYQVMAREIFNPNLALFVSVPEGGTTFQPNPNSVVQSDTGVSHLEFFKFVGRLVGKALYDGQLMDAYFTRSFYKHMLGQQLTYEDIEAVDPEYYKNLKWMLENDITDVLDLTFTAESDFFGKTEIVELVPGGREVKVTEANKHEYVNLIARHRMTTSIKAQIQAFLEGFWQLVPRELISIFNDHELELLISGLPDIDVADLRANSEYTGYSAASPVIQWFWQVVADMDKQDLALLLQFVTGTSKVPLGGFKGLQGISGPQRFQIHKSYGTDRLPSAHTCFNQLDLPDYESTEQLAERLAMAIHEGHEGFGFG